MPTTMVHGLSFFTAGDFLDEVKVSAEIEVTKRRGTSGVYTRAKAFNPTNGVEIKGGGSSGLAIGLSSASITTLSGGVKYLTKDENTQKSSDFDEFTSSLDHLPSAANV